MFGLHASAKTAGVDDDRKAKPCYDPADCVLTGLPIDLCLQFREGACLLVLDVAGSA